MIIFKDYIVKRLPNYIIEQDSYKDGTGKGFVYRFLEIFGEEIDDELYIKIENLVNELDPLTVDIKFLEYYAARLGDIPRLIDNDADFRRFLTWLISVYRFKGTKASYVALLSSLGISAVAVNEEPIVGALYDTGLLYDDGVFYDDTCQSCSAYSLDLTTAVVITGALYQKVISFVELIEPINATLEEVLWNGNPVTDYLIEVYIDENGDLIYNNPNDPDLVLTLVNGDLIIDGPNSEYYYIADNGDLHFILV